ncbi:hypothetical protein [Actibacterium sp. XHP0104]|uniref:hypothetical protein n=1 Tax=Actibacterium sp. XHP0104 TaxID=2984335 RepID=UPI0021E9801E|nr:hypothetical protein [Actibacterium sp. XHP0104]MCV2881703.1 hypothetical protein [Actibacterium sp. XHP0104]
MSEPSVTIVEAMQDPALFGDRFGADSWAAWRALLAAFYGLPLSDPQADTVRQLTARSVAPPTTFRELWMPIGRRGGKSNVAALIAVYEAAFRDHRTRLSSGEWATVALIAADRAQARTLLRYVRDMFAHPLLKPLVIKETVEGLELRNRCAIEVHTASYRKVRGYTLAAVIADEIAFWMDEGRSPDVEIIAALRPALATLDGRLVAISSPYARRGALWEEYRHSYGKDTSDRVLVAQAASRTMNPTLDERIVADAMHRDATRASAEFMAQFRSDIEAFLTLDQVQAVQRTKPLELPRSLGQRYVGFVDASGGGKDEFTIAIGHREKDRTVIDLVRGRKGNPAAITADYAKTLKAYGITSVAGDRYAGAWVPTEFARHGIKYEQAVGNRSELYTTLAPALNSGEIELPPCDVLARQLVLLERRTTRGGRDIIDHAPGGSDDRANAVAGVVAHMLKRNSVVGLLPKSSHRGIVRPHKAQIAIR